MATIAGHHHHSTDGTWAGVSDTYGSYVFIKREWNLARNHARLLRFIPRTTAHELTHLLLNTTNANGFNEDEHVENPDPSDPPKQANDWKYLMYFQKTLANIDTIIFSNTTRTQIDLTSKESVERTP